jgi:D-alanyl-D-alanine carboxypeptidase
MIPEWQVKQGGCMKKLTLLIGMVIALGIVASGCARGERAFDKDIQAQLERSVTENLAKFGKDKPVPGALVGVWVPGQGSWVKGIGLADIETGRAPDPNDHVRIGSNTKTFVVSTILQLVDEGKLTLDDSVDSFDLGVQIPDGDKITVRMLADMTGGLFEAYEVPHFFDKGVNPLDKFDPRTIVAGAAKQPLYFQPGKDWHYSNTGYLLLGMIIEKLTGNSVADEIQSRFIEKLGLTHTTYPTTYPGMPCPYMHGYMLKDGVWDDATVMYNPTMTGAAGAMISTMADMKKWVKAYVTGTTNSAAVQKQRLTCVDTPIPNTGFGLGIVCSNGWYGYTGGIEGYNTSAYYFPEKDATVIVFVNAKVDEPKPGVANQIVGDITGIITPQHRIW